MFKTPKFWNKRGFISDLLIPFCVFYFLYLRLRDIFYSQKKRRQLAVPVICVGNITVGGTGKTPVASALAHICKAKDKRVAFISRGYGGKLKGPVKVNPEAHTAKEVGDEPLLLARIAPCWVAKDRLAGSEAAIKDGANILIYDDGLQDMRMEKDLSFAVVDGTYGFGNFLILPCGPLRDRQDKALKQADAVIAIGKDKHELYKELETLLSLYKASTKPTTNISHEDKKWLAFAGIGHPQKFFHMLLDLEFDLVEVVPFADHYAYNQKDLKLLKKKAKKTNATLITTEKDAVRIPKEMLDDITICPIEIEWENENKLIEFIEQRITL